MRLAVDTYERLSAGEASDVVEGVHALVAGDIFAAQLRRMERERDDATRRVRHLEGDIVPSLEATISSQEAGLAETHARIADLEATGAVRAAELASARAKLSEKQTRLGEAQAQLTEAQTQLAELETTRAEEARLTGELAERDLRLAMIARSTSWRITAPLRFVGRSLRFRKP